MADNAGRRSDVVICAWCYANFPPGMNSTQTFGCASSVGPAIRNSKCGVPEGEMIICCGYGSCHDTSTYRFVRNPPLVRAKPICDACITKRLEAGDIEQLPGRYL